MRFLSQKTRELADADEKERRDLRRANRHLQDSNEWLLSALKEAEEKAERDQRIEDEHMRQGSS